MNISIFKKDGNKFYMKDFFEKNILDEIKKNESPPAQIENFISAAECQNLINYFQP